VAVWSTDGQVCKLSKLADCMICKLGLVLHQTF